MFLLSSVTVSWIYVYFDFMNTRITVTIILMTYWPKHTFMQIIIYIFPAPYGYKFDHLIMKYIQASDKL